MKVQNRHDACDEVVKPDLISIPEAARRVGVHSDTLYRLCRTGQFPLPSRSVRGGECRYRVWSDFST
jgi:predicted DNA-binding transcriptional regulator AlpA